MEANVVLMTAPGALSLDTVPISDPGAEDIVVDISHSGISTGTEKLFWTGRMPAFPGMSYPLVPGYESCGRVVEAGRASGFRPDDQVFVPGASCYVGAAGLFGGAASRVVTRGARATRIDGTLQAEGALLALAATAHHAIAGPGKTLPDLIVGHGVLGRLLARITLALGAPAPTVWEVDRARVAGNHGYPVYAPDADPRRDYACICDASGQADLLDSFISRLRRGGEVILAGFYAAPLSFAFTPAFLREARLRVAAEWLPEDMTATARLVAEGRLSLEGLVTHTRPATRAREAYEMAFGTSDCLKMILDWKGSLQ